MSGINNDLDFSGVLGELIREANTVVFLGRSMYNMDTGVRFPLWEKT
jgi:hypothetical protein